MLEIERKFLLNSGVDLQSQIVAVAERSIEIGQGYLSDDPDHTVRVRIAGDKGFITVKSRNHGCVRGEWEYPVPAADARQMISLPGVPSLIKTRYVIPYGARTWEVDVFGGRHSGLVIAEVELDSPDAEVDLPPFIGEEVTGDPRYYNSVLVKS